jgi:2,3-bisphosphoglycerate-dependent phosphoglycerate mutase
MGTLLGERTIQHRTRKWFQNMSLENRSLQTSTYVFLRHGESTGNAENRHQGQADYPLNEKGREQIQALARTWTSWGWKFDRAVSSPLIRAKESAKILSNSLGFDLEYDPIWMERDNGELAGLLHEEAQQVLPIPDFIPLFEPIGTTGESQWELYLRAGDALNQLLKFPPGRHLVISHGGLLNMVMLALVGLVPQPNFQGPRFRFSNAGYTVVRYEPGNHNWFIQEHNNTNHLLP